MPMLSIYSTISSVKELLRYLDADRDQQLETSDLQRKHQEGFFSRAENARMIVDLIDEQDEWKESLQWPLHDFVMKLGKEKQADFDNKGVYEYSKSEVILIQLWAHVQFDDPISIDGDRGNKWSMKGETNPYVWRLELSAQFPMAERLLSGLTNEQRKQALENYSTVYLNVKSQGRYFLEQIPEEMLEKLLINSVNRSLEWFGEEYLYNDFIAELESSIQLQMEDSVGWNTQNLLKSYDAQLKKLDPKSELYKQQYREIQEQKYHLLLNQTSDPAMRRHILVELSDYF